LGVSRPVCVAGKGLQGRRRVRWAACPGVCAVLARTVDAPVDPVAGDGEAGRACGFELDDRDRAHRTDLGDTGARQRDRRYCIPVPHRDGVVDVAPRRADSGGAFGNHGACDVGFVGDGVVDAERDSRLFPIKIALSLVCNLDVDGGDGVVESFTFKPGINFLVNFTDDELAVYVIKQS